MEVPQEVWDKLYKINSDLKPQLDLVEKLTNADPKLSPASALIIAGDILSKKKADTLIQSGMEVLRASQFVGSYSRLDWLVEQVEAGLIEEKELYPTLPELWSGSDPDDTDIRFLNLWRNAFRANKARLITDEGKQLPKKTLTIYRGQDGGVNVGIAWSLDENVARKFAMGAGTRQRDRGGIIYTAKISYRNVFAYLTGRGEQEIIVEPLWLY